MWAFAVADAMPCAEGEDQSVAMVLAHCGLVGVLQKVPMQDARLD